MPKDAVYIYGNVTESRNSIYFYGNYFFKKLSDINKLKPGDFVIVNAEDYSKFAKEKSTAIIFTGKGFPVTKLSLKFLTPSKRENELAVFYIVEVRGE